VDQIGSILSPSMLIRPPVGRLVTVAAMRQQMGE
jgi:hypothetical protein